MSEPSGHAEPKGLGRFEGKTHILPIRIYYEDTDLSGVVYHANYLRYMERGRTEFFRLAGSSFINGPVVFDGSLALVADVPVPAQALFKNNPRLMQALTNKTIKVPISGTLAKPALDPKAFEAAIAQLAKEMIRLLGQIN